MKDLYKALGRLKFKGNASKYAGNIAGIVEFKAKAKAEREKLRDEARNKAIQWAQGVLGNEAPAVEVIPEVPVVQPLLGQDQPVNIPLRPKVYT